MSLRKLTDLIVFFLPSTDNQLLAIGF